MRHLTMKRVVVTGIGAISPLGGNRKTISEALRNGTSAVCFSTAYEQEGLSSHVWAPISMELPELSRRQNLFLGEGDTLRYGYHAMSLAVEDSNLTEDQIRNPMTGIYAGTGGPSALDTYLVVHKTRTTGNTKAVGLRAVVPTMSSGLSAKLATDWGIQGANFSITSACATSAHCIGEAALKIALGMQTIMFAGGSEDHHETKAAAFDAMGALVDRYNENPRTASRPFDVSRAGFVHSGGGGIIVLEEYEHALRRGAHIYAELVGYGFSSDGKHMTNPSGDGAIRCMQMALQQMPYGSVQYINAHGTSTKVGDITEIASIGKAFENKEIPWISSRKAITGHGLGAAGVLEAIYSILALEGNFVPMSAHIETLDPEIAELPAGHRIARETIDMPLKTVMSNSFGFGGTNACLIFQKL